MGQCVFFSTFMFESGLLNMRTATSFIKIANETMCRPIRALTEARGYSTSSHM